MKPYFYLAYFHCQVVLSFMQNTLVLPFNIDVVFTLSITLVKSFQIHVCQNKDLQILWLTKLQMWNQQVSNINEFCGGYLSWLSTTTFEPRRGIWFHHFRHWALSVLTQMHQMVPYTFGFTYRSILYTLFFLRYFLKFSEFMFHRKSLRLPCHLRYHEGFVKFPMGLKVFSSQIMYVGVTYEG